MYYKNTYDYSDIVSVQSITIYTECFNWSQKAKNSCILNDKGNILQIEQISICYSIARVKEYVYLKLLCHTNIKITLQKRILEVKSK